MQVWDVHEITPEFGSEITGFHADLLSDAAIRSTLKDLFDRRAVLVFQNLEITHAQQTDLCMLFSGEEAPPEAESRGDGWYISNDRPNAAAPFGRLQFHSDMMWSDKPCEVLSLYGIDIEQPVVPTTFASAVQAWSTLPEDLRVRVDGLSAVHTAGEVRRGNVEDVLVSRVEQPPSTVKPVALPHPRTGESILYACEQMTQEIVGLPGEESEQLLVELFEHLYRPASLLHHEWRKQDLVIWDNLALQHARPNVRSDGPRRTLRKVASFIPPLSLNQRPVHSTV
jgi:alpha-ketoglutarate-dependent taurine dioxygenase